MTYRLSFTNTSDLMGFETLNLLYPVRARLQPLSVSISFKEGIRDRIVRVLTSRHPCLFCSLFSEFASLNLLIQEKVSFALKEVCVHFLLLLQRKVCDILSLSRSDICVSVFGVWFSFLNLFTNNDNIVKNPTSIFN